MSEIDGLKLLRRIEEGVAGKTGEAFFRQIVCDLARALNAHSAFTSRLLPGRRASMLAFWSGGAHEQCLEYALAGTPCEYVYRGEITSYARNVGDVFPVDRAWFEQLGIKSYLGIPVKNETGAVCGHLAVMDTRERDWADADVDILRLFSIRSAAELERLRFQGELEGANLALRTANERMEGEITRRAAMEEQLAAARNVAESANRAKSAFISQMSHELRTPLNGILGYAQLLRREYSGEGERLAEGLGIIERSGEHLLKLVNDLLDLAKIEAGKFELSVGPVDLSDLLEHVAGLTRVRATNAGLTFAVVVETGDLVPVIADERIIRQVLLNLLGNAVKFTEAGGRITLRVRMARTANGDQCVRFVVEDTGVGIEEGDLARVFEPFHRVNACDRRVEGTGLGLSITQRLVTALGGRLSVKSQRGAGSTFTVECELESAPSVRIDALPVTKIDGYRGRRRTVLVADDDADNRILITRLFEGVGLQVQATRNGREALELIRSRRPDLILTDLVMPVMDGMELVRGLRSDAANSQLPIIAMSASASEYTREEAMQAGCSAFLSKPLRLAGLLQTVGEHLGLEWERPAELSPEPPNDVADTGESFGPFQLQPHLAAQLLHLAMQGDVIALTAYIEETLSRDGAARPFCDAARALVARYDMRGVRQLVARTSGD